MFNHLSLTQKGMMLALLGFTGYALSDVCAKYMAQDFSIYQTIMMNNLFACLFLLALMPRLGGKKALFTIKHKKLQLVRAVLNVVISLTIMKSFINLPIADVYTFIFAMPFAATLLSVCVYKEHVTRSRWVAIFVGFAGVLIALQPGTQSFDPNYFWALACCLAIALMFTIGKSMQGESLFALGFWPLAANVLVCGLLAFAGDLGTLQIQDILIFAMNGAFIAMGIVCVSNAFRMAPAAAVSPFLYTEMVWALLFGYFLFGDVPDMVMLGGAAIIIASGIYLIETERRHRVL